MGTHVQEVEGVYKLLKKTMLYALDLQTGLSRKIPVKGKLRHQRRMMYRSQILHKYCKDCVFGQNTYPHEWLFCCNFQMISSWVSRPYLQKKRWMIWCDENYCMYWEGDVRFHWIQRYLIIKKIGVCVCGVCVCLCVCVLEWWCGSDNSRARIGHRMVSGGPQTASRDEKL